MLHADRANRKTVYRYWKCTFCDLARQTRRCLNTVLSYLDEVRTR